jgi:divalent metal cation (Fe/Co/Zn/Cd) transporter
MNVLRGDVVESQAAIVRRGRVLQWATISWNCVEAVVALIAGALAGSIALVGFGFDSVIEVISGGAALWRLANEGDERRREIVEQRSLRIIGVCFLLLAAYVTYEAIHSLVTRRLPDASVVGIVVAALSLVIMPLLVHLKRRIALGLRSGALEAERRQTRVCALLSAILLLGLGLNAGLGWWWADPVAGLAMVPLIAHEGWEAISGQMCCD